MTLFGIDISNNNGSGIDLNQVAAEGFSFVFAKVSEGNYFTDRTWPGYRDAALAAGLLVVGYHYVIAGDDPDAQAARFAGGGGGSVAMLDFEDYSGGLAEFWAVVAAFGRAGITIVCSYVPHWYWQQIGSPDLSQVPMLIASSYVSSWGYAAAIYPGDDAAGWAPYGGGAPDILQFTDKALVAGQWVDANAFRGGRDELAELFTAQPQGGWLMALTDQQQDDLYQKVSDIWDQLRGPGGEGWPQLGQNAQGANLTPVDALAELQTEVAALKGTQP
ncbi:MAG TPA: GH25 family lysozyme [Galbitalea sp.]|nr:GH25 family lysozyme [Galbitalea sp.]